MNYFMILYESMNFEIFRDPPRTQRLVCQVPGPVRQRPSLGIQESVLRRAREGRIPKIGTENIAGKI